MLPVLALVWVGNGPKWVQKEWFWVLLVWTKKECFWVPGLFQDCHGNNRPADGNHLTGPDCAWFGTGW